MGPVAGSRTGGSISAGGCHHGDLRTALLTAAVEMLEGGEALTIWAVARRAGVSPSAPYRHFADREALELRLNAELDRLAPVLAQPADLFEMDPDDFDVGFG